jgi:Uma2 family endonuclease
MTQQAFEQFLAQPENSEGRFELVNGEIVEKQLTQFRSLMVSMFVGILNVYRQKHPTVWVLPGVGVKLPGDIYNGRIPDISVLLHGGRVYDLDAPLNHMPDLVIEIQSPSQSDKFMSDKADYYLGKGARRVWLVYTKKRIIEVRTKDDRHLLTDEDTLDGGDILPGFSVAIKDVFAQP